MVSLPLAFDTTKLGHSLTYGPGLPADDGQSITAGRRRSRQQCGLSCARRTLDMPVRRTPRELVRRLLGQECPSYVRQSTKCVAALSIAPPLSVVSLRCDQQSAWRRKETNHVVQEPSRRAAIDQSMIIREAQRHHQTNLDFIVHHDGHFSRAADQ